MIKDSVYKYRDVISSDNPKWKYLANFLRGVNWYQIEGALVGTHLATHDFKLLIDDDYMNTFNLNKELSEGYITYRTSPPETTLLPLQHITLKWKLFDCHSVHIFITGVEVCG